MSFRLFIVLFLACVASAWAGRFSLSIEGAADYARQHHPGLAAARLRLEEARGRLQQSGRLSNPELELEFTRHTAGSESSAGLALVQRFPLTARLRHEKAISRAELAAADAEIRDQERLLTAEVRTAAVKLQALSAQRDLQAQQLRHSRELSDFLRQRVAAGEAPAVDASQQELEARQLEIEHFQQAADEAALLGELRPLLGLAGDEEIVITGELSAPRNLPGATDVTARADIAAAQARAQAARALVQVQRAKRWEDLGVGVSYTRDRTLDEPEPVETEHIVGLRFSLPLPLWNNEAGRIREAEAAASRAALEAGATKLRANAEAAAARAAMRACAKLIGELDTQVLPAATRIEEQLRQSYSAGQTPLTDFLRARTRHLELQRQRLHALRDYHLARVRHAAATSQSSPASSITKP